MVSEQTQCSAHAVLHIHVCQVCIKEYRVNFDLSVTSHMNLLAAESSCKVLEYIDGQQQHHEHAVITDIPVVLE